MTDPRPPAPLPATTVAGLISFVVGLTAWPLTGYWQAALIGAAACLIAMLVDAARMQRRRAAEYEARRGARLDR